MEGRNLHMQLRILHVQARETCIVCQGPNNNYPEMHFDVQYAACHCVEKLYMKHKMSCVLFVVCTQYHVAGVLKMSAIMTDNSQATDSYAAKVLWKCKLCTFSVQTRLDLLNHYKCRHCCRASFMSWPCLYSECILSFKSLCALKTHLSRYHSSETESGVSAASPCILRCPLCSSCEICDSKQLTVHLSKHFATHETVVCPVKQCDYRSRVKSTFRSHLSRYHPYPIPVSFLKASYVAMEMRDADDLSVYDNGEHEQRSDVNQEVSNHYVKEDEFNLHSTDVGDPLHSLAMTFLHLQMYKNVPATTVQSFIDGVNAVHLMSKPHLCETVKNILATNGITDEAVAQKVVDATVKEHPFYMHTSRTEQLVGCLSSGKLREAFFRKQTTFVEPREIILGRLNGKARTFMYIPILDVLQSLLQKDQVLNVVLTSNDISAAGFYCSFLDGSVCRNHPLFSEEHTPIMIGLYYDDFESNNPLGTTRKKYKVCAFYWVFSNIHRSYRSALHTMQLALLAKSDDVKQYGFSAVLDPLLRDISTLEKCGIYVESLGRSVKGSIAYLVADNLAANSIGGFVESFSPNVRYFCRFCLTGTADALAGHVHPSNFQSRTQENYADQVCQLTDNPDTAICYGLKKSSPLHKHLQYFHVVDGLPADACHDLLEGVVPVEIAMCLAYFIRKNYFTHAFLNRRIECFPYKITDKVNRPQQIPENFAAKGTIGGNMAENMTLIHMLPLIIAHRVPIGDPAWELLMELKDIVDIVFSPKFTEETIDFLQVKILDHRQLLRVVFPEFKGLPKLHFLDHYPALIRKFGPLVDVCTVRFEAKHSELKHVMRRAHNMKNLLKTLATRHQFVQAYHLSECSYFKPDIQINSDSDIPVSVLSPAVQNEICRVLGHQVTAVMSSKTVTFKGLTYRCGMFVSYGYTSGLPDFASIEHVFVLNGNVYFHLHSGTCSYDEHYHAYEFVHRQVFYLVPWHDLNDYYPLCAYDIHQSHIGRRKLIMPKHFILVDTVSMNVFYVNANF